MIKNITILGAGTMGHGTAIIFGRFGYKIKIFEPFESARENAARKIKEAHDLMLKEGYINQEEYDLGVTACTFYDDLEEAAKDADLVIEACPEIVELKQDHFAKLDKICKPTTIFGTNTSSLKLQDIMAKISPERFKKAMVIHFYNPAYLIPIVELSNFGNMAKEDFEEVKALFVACKKVPVGILKDIPGMIANRMLHAQAREVFYLNQIGAATTEDIEKTLMYGPSFRNATTGMLEVADMGGLDIWCTVGDNLFPAICSDSKSCDSIRGHVENGELGLKSGKGFFEYGKDEDKYGEFLKRLITQLKASETYMK